MQWKVPATSSEKLQRISYLSHDLKSARKKVISTEKYLVFFFSVNFSSGIATKEMIENLLFPHSWRNCWKKKHWQHIKIIADYKYSQERDSHTTNAAARTDMALAVPGTCWSRWSSRSGKEERVRASSVITWWCSPPERHAGSSELLPPPSSPHVTPYHVPWVTWNRVLLLWQTGCRLYCLILSPYTFL